MIVKPWQRCRTLWCDLRCRPRLQWLWLELPLDPMGSAFVGRMKTNVRYDVIGSRVTQSDRALSDEVIQLNSDKAKRDCPIPLRRIVFERAEDKSVGFYQ